MAKVKNRLMASSLVEVTVAMVLLTLTIGLALTVLLSLAKAGEHSRRLKWRTLAQAHVTETIEQGMYINGEEQKGEVTLVRVVQPHDEAKRLLLVEALVLHMEGDTLARYSELVYVAEEKN